MENKEGNVIVEPGKSRSSNLELYRIICMFMIVAHHYVVNSGIVDVLYQEPLLIKSIYYFVFGMWGKVGINCFVLITGYFMCIKRITLKKFLKLLSEIWFYNVIIFIIFFIAGKEIVTPLRLVKLIIPFWGIDTGFVGCFILFYLLIPFLSVIVHNITQQQHLWLVLGCLTVFSILGTIPSFDISFNYVGWFCILFFVSSYIRLHPIPLFDNLVLWRCLGLSSIFLAIISVVVCIWIHVHFSIDYRLAYWFVADSNKLMAVVVSITTFLWFKNVKIRDSVFVNMIAASTFGVLLIHANSDAMRQWLWRDLLDVSSQYYTPMTHIIIHSLVCVLCVFSICIVIDIIRKRIIEDKIFK